MPYIAEELRKYWDEKLTTIIEFPPLSKGELNYVITRIVTRYWNGNQSYDRIADVDGVLQNVAREFYRRIAVPYEEKKRAESGDVY